MNVFGALTIKAAKRLVAEIKLLKEKSDRPIIVYIKSGGGEVEAFYELENIFSPKDSTEKSGEIITVAHRASSAAAYLFVIGDFAYAFKEAKLHFHGVRCTDPKRIKMLRGKRGQKSNGATRYLYTITHFSLIPPAKHAAALPGKREPVAFGIGAQSGTLTSLESVADCERCPLAD